MCILYFSDCNIVLLTIVLVVTAYYNTIALSTNSNSSQTKRISEVMSDGTDCISTLYDAVVQPWYSVCRWIMMPWYSKHISTRDLRIVQWVVGVLLLLQYITMLCRWCTCNMEWIEETQQVEYWRCIYWHTPILLSSPPLFSKCHHSFCRLTFGIEWQK